MIRFKVNSVWLVFGGAVIGYTDDHNDFDGHTYVTHQIGGPGLNKDKTSVPAPGPAPAPQSGPFPLAADVGGEPGSTEVAAAPPALPADAAPLK